MDTPRRARRRRTRSGVGTGMGRRSARALGESPRGVASASRVMTSPKKEASFGKSSGTALNAYASASHVRAVDDGVVGELADRRFSHGASKEKRAGGDGGLPPTSLSTRTTPIKGRGMSVDMDVVTQRASFQKYRGDEVGAASKDVIKGRVGCNRQRVRASSRRLGSVRCTSER